MDYLRENDDCRACDEIPVWPILGLHLYNYSRRPPLAIFFVVVNIEKRKMRDPIALTTHGEWQTHASDLDQK